MAYARASVMSYANTQLDGADDVDEDNITRLSNLRDSALAILSHTSGKETQEILTGYELIRVSYCYYLKMIA